jgi:predicted metal-dependent hydrolase
MVEYDPRYLAGILFFNRRDFFEAHEVWEELWGDSHGPDHRFVQGLIQAAVALYHFGNGNLRGAHRLYHSARDYMSRTPSPHWGLDVDGFWKQMEQCFAGILKEPFAQGAALKEELIPTIVLDPMPESWPEPTAYLRDEQ